MFQVHMLAGHDRQKNMCMGGMVHFLNSNSSNFYYRKLEYSVYYSFCIARATPVLKGRGKLTRDSGWIPIAKCCRSTRT